MMNYHQALHAMQAGVAQKMNLDPTDTTPKHLRVGINAVMCDHTALVRLLMGKGIFTEAEYREEITAEMLREVERYEAHLSERMGVRIKLGSLVNPLGHKLGGNDA